MKSGAPAGSRAFARFAWGVLIYAVAVIIWGAVVRATGSGAGCGAHWPLCNGDVVPLAPGVATVIEYAHRATSGLILILCAALWALSLRVFPRGHAARGASAWALFFCLVEAAIGAGIVLLRLVEHNASAARAIYVAAHLMNTLILVGALTATVWSAQPRTITWSPDVRAHWERLFRFALAALLLVSAAGAVVALGDTLFPAATLAAGLAADRDPAAHVLLRLRVWHPVFAVATAGYLFSLISRSDAYDEPALARAARVIAWLVSAQIVLGAINILALAPLWLQMAHLLVSNTLWVAVVWVWLQVRGGLRRPPVIEL